MKRVSATLAHLGIGAAAFGISLALVRFAWYPEPYFTIQHASRTLPILAVVCLAFGPLLTLLVFRPGKKNLRFDLAVIALLQLGAFAFVIHSLYVERPSFMVFAADRFNVLRAGDVDTSKMADTRLPDKPWIGPLAIVAKMPTDPEELSRLTREVLFEGKPDLDRRPEYWAGYAEAYDEVKAAAASVSLLKEMSPAAAAEVDRVAEVSGLPVSELWFVPVTGKRGDFAVIIRKADGAVLDAIGTDP